jgi:MerR family transcriptional regulator, redox-sensitive transcriptional activator SoxR
VDGFPDLTIGQVARRAGLASSAIRYYESIGLLPEPDRVGGQRRYDERVLGRLAFIGVARNAGFKLSEIGELMDGVDSQGEMAGSMRSLSERKLPEVDALLERTQAMKGWLEVARTCGCKSPEDCALFPAPGEQGVDIDEALKLIHVDGDGCRRAGTPS